MVKIERYAGKEADINSYLLSSGRSLIVVDLLKKSPEAEKLPDRVEATGKELEAILITRGHSDRSV